MRTILIWAAVVIILLNGTDAFSGDLECYGYTSTTSHFECGTHGNCVWWTAYMRPDIAAAVTGGGWNGGQWYDKLAGKGFDVGSEPKVDAVGEFSDPGHVVYVTGLGENGVFNVSEMDATGKLGSGILYATYYPGNGNTYHRNKNLGTDKNGNWTLQGFIYRRQSGTNTYCYDISSFWGICWIPSDTDVSCQGGKDWELHDFGTASTIRVSTNEYCSKTSGIGGGSSGSSSGLPYPNLQIRKFEIQDKKGNIQQEATSILHPGNTYTTNVWPVSTEEDCVNGMHDGKDTVETDTFLQIGGGSWLFLNRNYTQCSTLTKDDSNQETFTFKIPSSAVGKTICFRSKVDATKEFHETDESDNWSDTECYKVDNLAWLMPVIDYILE